MMSARKIIIALIAMTATALFSSVAVFYAARNAGAFWSGFDSQDGSDTGLESGFVVVDAIYSMSSNIDGIGPFKAEIPSFVDTDIILFEDGDLPEEPVSDDAVNVVWKEVRVAAGDTLSKIAEASGCSMKEIMRANEISDEHKLREGQILYIPNSPEYVLETLDHVRRLKNDEVTRKKQAKAVSVTNYVVKDGDTLWSIANAFDLDINSLFGSNKLTDSSVLKVGAQIRVPNQDGIFHKVKNGDTLDKLAKEYETYLEAILLANEMTSSTALAVGSEIFLPGAKVSSAVGSATASNQKKQTSTRDSVKASQGFGWPVGGKISSSFAWRRDPIRGGRDFHTGLDIRAPRGRPVVASRDGTVVHSGWMGGYGKTIVIQHTNGLTTLYAHNSSLIVKKGAKVRRGQKIALVGSTGRSTGPHVHFEIRKNGTPMNPLKYLK